MEYNLSQQVLLLHNRHLHGMSQYYAAVPLLTALAVLLFSYVALRLLHFLVLRPASHRRALLQQGIDAPPYRPLSGDLPNIARMEAIAHQSALPSASSHHLLFPYISPYYHQRISQLQVSNGSDTDHPFAFWLGSQPTVVLTHPEDVKLVMSADVKHLQKNPASSNPFKELFGTGGLLLANGDNWHSQRNILRPAFFAEKLKEMVAEMVTSSLEMVDRWAKHVRKQGGHAELEVAMDLKDATADILARTSFGSSYLKGRSVFNMQVELLDLLMKVRVMNAVMPASRLLPTADNMRVRELEKIINHDLTEIVESGRKLFHSKDGASQAMASDLLGLILHAEEQEVKQGSRTVRLTTQEVIDECKTFFFAGHETTANLLAWTMVLLSLNQEWQEKAREEMMEICGKHGVPKADDLNKMKIVGMVLNESLRLYPPVPEYGRRVVRPNQGGFKLGNRTLPEGTAVTVSSVYIHRRKDLWGDDADEFNPERFGNGVAKACKHPHGFMPFGQGPRICIGQNFALMEAKVIMAVILQRFRFALSPNYVHAPATAITMRPKHGVQVILESL